MPSLSPARRLTAAIAALAVISTLAFAAPAAADEITPPDAPATPVVTEELPAEPVADESTADEAAPEATETAPAARLALAVAPAQLTQVAPADGALLYPTDATVTLSWTDPQVGTNTYQIQGTNVQPAAGDIVGAPFVYDAPLNPNAKVQSYVVPGVGAATYWWQVRAVNSEGTAGPWSAVRKLIVAAPAPTNTECLPADVQNVTISSAAQLSFDNRAGGTAQLTSNGLALNWHGPDLSQAKAAWYYAVDFPLSQLGTPTINYSVTSGANVGQNFSVTDNGAWKGNIVREPGIANYWTTFSIPGMSADPTASYRKAIGTINDFLAAYATDTAVNGTAHNVRVVAIGGSGGSGSEGVGVLHGQTAGCYALTFKAPAPPLVAPVISTPSNNSATNTATVNASWGTVALATSYETRIATNAAMTEGLVGPSGPFGTSTTISVAEGTYWFQVRGVNADGAGPWSIARKFSTDVTLPHVVSETQAYQPNQGGRIAVTLTFSEPIKAGSLGQGWNGSSTSWTKIYYTSKSYTASFTDLVGNAGTYDFTVDATKPTVTGIQQVWQANQGGRIAVTLTFSESIDSDSLPQGWYGTGTTFTKVFYTTKEVTVAFADLVGNPGTYTFTVDATAPTAPVPLSPGGYVIASNGFSWLPSVDASGPVTYEVAIGNHPNLVGGAGTAMSSGFQSLGTTTASNLPYALPIGPAFWQVRAVDSVGNYSKWTAPVGVQVIGKPVLSSTATNPLTGDLTVSWTVVNGIGGNDGYQVEYALADGSTVVHFVTTGLTDTQVASVDNQGAVSVRVRAIYAIGFTAGDPASKNGEWSNTLAFTRDSIGPVAPQPVNPENGRVQSNSTPTLVWLAAPDAVTYDVRTSTGPGRDASNELNGGGIQTFATADLQQLLPTQGEGWIWWQVRGVDALGNVGPWSSIWATGVDTVAPGDVTLDFPANDALLNNNTFDVTWFAATDAVKYVVESSTVQPTAPGAFATLAGGGTREVTVPSFNAGGSPDATYYWHVRAVDAAGNLGAWSETRALTIDTVAPGDVTLLSPANPTSTTSSTLEFSWEDLAELPFYVFEVSSSNEQAGDGGFLSFPEGDAWIADGPGGTLSNIPAGTYYWHVAALDEAGNLGNWSPIWSFTVTEPAAPPAVTPPATTNGAVAPPAATPFTFVTTAGQTVPAVAPLAALVTTADSTTEELPTLAVKDEQLPTEAFHGEPTAGDAPWWPWAVGIALLLLLALLSLLLLRRRRAGGTA